MTAIELCCPACGCPKGTRDKLLLLKEWVERQGVEATGDLRAFVEDLQEQIEEVIKGGEDVDPCCPECHAPFTSEICRADCNSAGMTLRYYTACDHEVAFNLVERLNDD